MALPQGRARTAVRVSGQERGGDSPQPGNPGPGTLEATIAKIRRNKVPHSRRRKPNKTILGWMARWGSPVLCIQCPDKINTARWKLPLGDWWPVEDIGSHGLALPPVKDWRPGGDPDAGPDEYSQ